MSIDGVDDKTRTLFISAVGREKGEDPYFPHLYRVGYDGTGLKLLNPGNASHAVTIDRRRALLRRQLVARRRGARVGAVRHARERRDEAGDAGSERAQGGRLQVPRAVRGQGRRRRHGSLRRDVQAVRLRPEEEVSDHRLRLSRAADRERDQDVQPARQQHVARAVRVHRDRGRQPRRQPAAVEVVPQLRLRQPARLRPGRQEGGDRAARARATRTSTSTASASGATRAAASCRRRRCSSIPDFFKVAWSESGNHENNIYNNTWSEKHHGIKEVDKDGKVTFEFSIEKNSELAKNLKGHLMLIDRRHRQQRPPGEHAIAWPTR